MNDKKKDEIIEVAIELEKKLNWYFKCKAKGCFHPTLIDDTRQAKEALEKVRRKFRTLIGGK